MKNCPKCKSENIRKDGTANGNPRHFCKDCEYRFTVKHIGKPDDIKRDALILYLEGLGFRSIGRFLKVSHVSIFNWIKTFGGKLDELRSADKIEVIEIDELHTYIGSKKTTVGYGSLLIEMGIDSSITKWVQGERKQVKSSGRRLRIR